MECVAVGWIVEQFADARRDPWWDPDGRRRRRNRPRRLLELALVALVLASLGLGLQARIAHAGAATDLDPEASIVAVT
jgi:hypothetical protein